MRAIQLQSASYRGIDTVRALTADQSDALVADGVSWVARYIPSDDRRLEDPDDGGGDWRGCWTLSRSEARAILGAGLCLLPVQWGPSRGDVLSAVTGQHKGRQAASAARWLGCPEGVHLWCDYEGGRAVDAGPVAGREYLEAWSAAVTAAGYRAGLYVSIPQPLTGRQIYGLRGYTSYWGAAQASLPVPLPRGYSIRQEHYTTVCGVPADPDTLCADRRGDVPTLWGQ